MSISESQRKRWDNVIILLIHKESVYVANGINSRTNFLTLLSYKRAYNYYSTQMFLRLVWCRSLGIHHI